MIQQIVKSVVLAGGRGSRLGPLTDRCTKPAVYFGGKYRIIDFVLSNCINSGFRNILVLTQYKSQSLQRHIYQGWGMFQSNFRELIEVIPAQQQLGKVWYRGTADAVYQNLEEIKKQSPRYVLILAGDHIYKMNYSDLVRDHIERRAEVTIAGIEVKKFQATAFGVMEVNEMQRVVGFKEKPETPQLISGQEVALVSMGIYLFNMEVLEEWLLRDAENSASSHDFGKDLLPSLIREAGVFVHKFQDPNSKVIKYWRDVGTVDTYFDTSMDLINRVPQLNLYDPDWPIWAAPMQVPPAKFVFNDPYYMGIAGDSIITDGCVIDGGRVRHSILCSGTRIHNCAELEEVICLPGVNIGRYCRLKRVILDENTRVPEGTVIGEDPKEDGRWFYVTDHHVVVVNQETLDRRSEYLQERTITSLKQAG